MTTENTLNARDWLLAKAKLESPIDSGLARVATLESEAKIARGRCVALNLEELATLVRPELCLNDRQLPVVNRLLWVVLYNMDRAASPENAIKLMQMATFLNALND